MSGCGGERVTVLKEDIVMPRALLPVDEDDDDDDGVGKEAVTMATG